MNEIWEDIKNFEGYYQVSNLGKVKSLKRGRMLKDRILNPNNRDYLAVCLYKNKNKKRITIHCLVWDVFGNQKRDCRELDVDHIDNNRFNNRIDNLQLLTHRDNCTKGKLLTKKTSKYTGVCWYKSLKKWMAGISCKGYKYNLGYFNTEYEAHLIYEKAKQILKTPPKKSLSAFVEEKLFELIGKQEIKNNLKS